MEQRKKEVLMQFRQALSDVLLPQHDDFYLMRWLLVNYTSDFDVKKSEADLRAHLKWRAQVGADSIGDWTPPEVLRKYFPGGLHGFDKGGRPIWFEPLGCSDIKGLIKSAKKSDILKLKIQHFEHIENIIQEQRKKLGDHVDGLIVIFDLEHLGMHHLWKPAFDVYLSIIAIIEQQYPGQQKRTYVINAPLIFPLAYNIAKPFLRDASRRSIVMLGKNWKSVLLHDIDADQLPVHWGGTATDPDGDPCCRSKVNMGGLVSHDFYLPSLQAIDRESFTHADVRARSSFRVELKVSIPNSSLRWQFVTEDMDIAFGISCMTSGGHQVEVLPVSRVHSHLVAEDGSVMCPEPGLYAFSFDNTFSWLHKKSVWYNIDIMEPSNTMPASERDS